MHENLVSYFQELKIFQDHRINVFCDKLRIFIKHTLGEELVLCGSVAKVLVGELSPEYKPKDIDFVLEFLAFERLAKRINEAEFNQVVMIEKRPERIIIYTAFFLCIEIWRKKPADKKKNILLHNNKIPIICPKK